jgi:NAD-reducing hydrogenase small subunit
MSFLDIDERLIELAEKIDLVYSPLVDAKEYPADVDVALVEGAISSESDLHKIREIRDNTRVLVSLGDCAVTGNVPSMRDVYPVSEVLSCVYDDLDNPDAEIPNRIVPRLLKKVRPIHELVPVDVFVPGCPPSADTIFNVISELLLGHVPETVAGARFGA